MDKFAESVVIAGFHIKLPSGIGKPQRHAYTAIDSTGAGSLREYGMRYNASCVTSVTPPRIDRQTWRRRRNNIVFVDRKMTVIPSPSSNGIDPKCRAPYTIHMITVVGG